MENVKKKNYLIIMLIAIGIIVMFSFILQLSGGFRSVLVSNSISQGITVNGEGFIIVKPDIARVTLGMEAVAAIDQSIQAGANNVQNVSFSVESPGKWRDQAIAKAVKEARAKGESLARAAGTRIKRIIAINESTIDVRPYQMDYSYKKAEILRAGENMNTPLEPGSVKVTANVQMNFGI